MVRCKIIFTCSVIIIMLSISVAVFAINNRVKLGIPDIDNISSVKIIPVRSAGGETTELFFNLDKAEHKDMVNNILEWLMAGRVQGSVEEERFSFGGAPTCLIIESRNGKSIRIETATGTASTVSLGDASVADSKYVKGIVTIYAENLHKPVRELAPELSAFIEGGWKKLLAGYN